MPNIYGHWHLNESSGSNVPDSSGNNRYGTAVNMEDADWVAGKLNNCLQFDGTNEYVNLGDIGSFERTDAFSVECWVKLDDWAFPWIISRMLNPIPYTGWGIRAFSGKIKFYLYGEYSAARIEIEGTNSIHGSWHHLVVTYDGSSLASGAKIYIDSVEEDVTVNADNLINSMLNSVNCQISGRDGANACFKELVDEVVIYDKELSQVEITYRYNAGAGTEGFPDVDKDLRKTVDDGTITKLMIDGILTKMVEGS